MLAKWPDTTLLEQASASLEEQVSIRVASGVTKKNALGVGVHIACRGMLGSIDNDCPEILRNRDDSQKSGN